MLQLYCHVVDHSSTALTATLALGYVLLLLLLLQLLITCLFPDTPRAANALLSFNNKPVKQAVSVCFTAFELS
jgi:Protein of unknown function (DUF1350)